MYREEKPGKMIPFLISVVLTAALAVIVVLKFGMVYASNDDEQLRNIVSGIYTGTPDAHMIYVMYPLGLILKGLYNIAGKVSWYDGFLTLMHFLCIFLILYRVGLVFKSLSGRLVAMAAGFVLTVVFEFSSILVTQYTSLAGFIAATAIFWLVTVNFAHKPKSDAAVVIFLFIITLWLRKQVFFLSLPFAVLGLLFDIFDNNDTVSERFEKFKDCLVPVIVAAVLVLVSFGIEMWAYSSDEWKAFKEFNAARTEVYDYDGLPDYNTNTEFYEELGISEAMYTGLREGDRVVMDAISTDTLVSLYTKAGEISEEWARYYSVPRKVIEDTVSAMVGKNAEPLAIFTTIIFFMLFIFLMVNDEKLAGAVIAAVYAFEWLFVGYFTYLQRLPERVTHGFFMMELMFFMAVFIRVIKRSRLLLQTSLFWQILVCASTLVLSASFLLYTYRTASDALSAKCEKAQEWQELNDYFKSNPDNIYIVNRALFSNSTDVMFAENEADAHNTLMYNWCMKSPLESERLERLDITGVEEALSAGENTYYVLGASKSFDWLETLYGELEITDTVTLSNGVSIYIIKVR